MLSPEAHSQEKPQRKTYLSHIKNAVKIASLATAVLIFSSFLFMEPQTAQHNITRASEARVFVMKTQDFLTPNEQLYTSSEYSELEETLAIRYQTSFDNLAAGCTALTYWTKPLETRNLTNQNQNKDEDEADENYDESWTSYPPVKGNYQISTDWEGPRITVRSVGAEALDSEIQMSFSDALKLLDEGNNVIWYHPRMLEEDPFGLEELRGAVLDQIIAEGEANQGAFYLAELPEYYGLASMNRNVYYTKLNYTQSCIKFNNKILESFYYSQG